MNEEDLIKCYSCHKKLIEERVIDGKLQKFLSPERVITQFYLNNGSKMDVALCYECKNIDLDSPEIQDNIMNNIIDGWQLEKNILLEREMITQEQMESSMKYHKSLNIKFKSEGMNDYQIKAKANAIN
jgi:hypothetical protein